MVGGWRKGRGGGGGKGSTYAARKTVTGEETQRQYIHEARHISGCNSSTDPGYDQRLYWFTNVSSHEHHTTASGLASTYLLDTYPDGFGALRCNIEQCRASLCHMQTREIEMLL